MRLNHFIVGRHVTGGAAALAAAVLLGLAGPVRAQSLDGPAGAPVAGASASVPYDVIPVTRDALVASGIVPATFEPGKPQTGGAPADSDAIAADATPSADDSIISVGPTSSGRCRISSASSRPSTFGIIRSRITS